MKKLKLIFILMIVSLLSVPGVAFAEGWAEKTAAKITTFMLGYFFEPVFDALVEALGYLMITPSFDDPSMTYVKLTMQHFQIIAGCLLVLTFGFRLFKIKVGAVTGGQTEPLPDMIFRALMSAAMIPGLPYFLDWLINVNRALIEYIQARGVDLTKSLNLLSFPDGSGILLLVAFIIFIVALIGLTVSNAIRIAELCILYVFAPIMAVSYTGKGETFQIWITQAISVTFTQALQFFLVGLSMNMVGELNATKWWTLIAPIGAIVVAIRGPQLLKQYIYSSGVGGFATGMAQSATSGAIYARMMKLGGK